MVTFQGSIPWRSGVSISIVVVMCHWSQVEAERMELMKAKHSDIGNELILLQSHHDNYRCFDRLQFNGWIYMDYIYIYGNLKLVCFCINLIKILNAHTTWKEKWMASNTLGCVQTLFGRRVYPFDVYFSNRYSDHHLNMIQSGTSLVAGFHIQSFLVCHILNHKGFNHLFSTLPGFFLVEDRVASILKSHIVIVVCFRFALVDSQ